MTDKLRERRQRHRALQVEIDRARASGNAFNGYLSLKAKHQRGSIALTYDDLVIVGYLLGFKYGWATVQAFELGIFTLKHPVTIENS